MNTHGRQRDAWLAAMVKHSSGIPLNRAERATLAGERVSQRRPAQQPADRQLRLDAE